MSKTLKEKGNLNYLFKNFQQTVKDGKATTFEEIVLDGPRGISIKYYSKSGSEVEKIVIYGKDDEYKMKTSDGEKVLTKSELVAELKSNKKLKFAADFAKTLKGGSRDNKNVAEGGGSKKSSKKSSKKKVSKKSSKKSSKKTSKKTSKKSSKRKSSAKITL